jgi:hypothetical protein
MDLCEPAGPSFASTDKRFAPAQKASKLVQIINTNSFGYGTGIYDGHINFKMGHCGLWQDGQGSPPMVSFEIYLESSCVSKFGFYVILQKFRSSISKYKIFSN